MYNPAVKPFLVQIGSPDMIINICRANAMVAVGLCIIYDTTVLCPAVMQGLLVVLTNQLSLPYMQASFEAAQLPPVHQTKPGMKALKVLPGQQLQAKQHCLNLKAMPSYLL